MRRVVPDELENVGKREITHTENREDKRLKKGSKELHVRPG